MARINQRGYKFYVVSGNKIESGWEYREDAGDALKDLPDPRSAKVLTKTFLKSRGIDPDDDASWVTTAPRAAMQENRSMNLVAFKSWPEVLAYARTGRPLYYKAPMDHQAVRLLPGHAQPPSYEAKQRSIRIWPFGSVGRGRSRSADPFNADSGHLDRFLRPEESEARASGMAQARRRRVATPAGRGHRVAADHTELKEIGHIGDVNWPEHGGGPIYERPDGTCFLVYVEPPTDEVEFNDPEARWTVYSVELDPSPPSWGNANAVAASTDQSPIALKNAFKNHDPMKRAWAYETWAGYYGWNEFDQYARQLTCAEMNEEFDADIDCAPPEEEEQEDEDEEEEDDEQVIDAKTVLDGLGSYLKHEGHDAPREAARIADLLENAAHTNKRAEKALEEVDKLINGHGVEAIEGDYVDSYHQNIVATYVNMGDTYNTTVLYETATGRFFITTWGDWVERNERKYNIS